MGIGNCSVAVLPAVYEGVGGGRKRHYGGATGWTEGMWGGYADGAVWLGGIKRVVVELGGGKGERQFFCVASRHWVWKRVGVGEGGHLVDGPCVDNVKRGSDARPA